MAACCHEWGRLPVYGMYAHGLNGDGVSLEGEKTTSPPCRVPVQRAGALYKLRKALDLDFHFYATGKLELHEGVNGLCCRAVDVDQTLVV